MDGTLLPTPELVSAVLELRVGEALTHRGRSLAFCRAGIEPSRMLGTHFHLGRAKVFPGEVISFKRPWNIFQHCGRAVLNDFALLTRAAPASRWTLPIPRWLLRSSSWNPARWCAHRY